jgi:hypothetical protein
MTMHNNLPLLRKDPVKKKSFCIFTLLLSLTPFAFESNTNDPAHPELQAVWADITNSLHEQDHAFQTVAIRLMQHSTEGNVYIVPDTESYRFFLEQVQETFPQAEVLIAGGRDLEQGENFAWWKEQDPLPACSVVLELDNGESRKRTYLRQAAPEKFANKPSTQPSRSLFSTTEICVFAAATTTAIAFSYLGTRYLKQRSNT